jgi:hypothetical protein
MADINLTSSIGKEASILIAPGDKPEPMLKNEPSAVILLPQDTRAEGVEEPPPNSPEALAEYAKKSKLPKVAAAYLGGKTAIDVGKRQAIGEKEKEAQTLEDNNEAIQEEINLKISQKSNKGFLGYKLVPSKINPLLTILGGGTGLVFGMQSSMFYLRDCALSGQSDPFSTAMAIAITILPPIMLTLGTLFRFGGIEEAEG